MSTSLGAAPPTIPHKNNNSFKASNGRHSRQVISTKWTRRQTARQISARIGVSEQRRQEEQSTLISDLAQHRPLALGPDPRAYRTQALQNRCSHSLHENTVPMYHCTWSDQAVLTLAVSGLGQPSFKTIIATMARENTGILSATTAGTWVTTT
ncbi:hypothetical protein Bbelb_128230 [Branchiostoma belcheri]|nr:hypothetical protein Bbelb_128230 [Branchiostoma belcheri]